MWVLSSDVCRATSQSHAVADCQADYGDLEDEIQIVAMIERWYCGRELMGHSLRGDVLSESEVDCLPLSDNTMCGIRRRKVTSRPRKAELVMDMSRLLMTV